MKTDKQHRDVNARPPWRAAHDEAADFLDQFYRNHRRWIMMFMAKHGADRASLEDLAQEVFLRAWKNRSRFRGDSSLKTYIFGIAQNVLYQDLRRRSKRNITLFVDFPVDTDFPELYVSPDESESDAQQQLYQALEQATAKLPPQQRQAIELVQTHNLPRKKAIQLANCTPRQFAVRLCRAKKRLKQLLKTTENR